MITELGRAAGRPRPPLETPGRSGLAAHDDGALVSLTRPMMGGGVGIHLDPGRRSREAAARRDAWRLLARIEAWAARLTRFAPTSDLVRLNASLSPRVTVRPTLEAILDWGRVAQAMSDGIVDIALLDARLEAEGLVPRSLSPATSPASRRWSLDRRARGSVVIRPVGLTFDLDGVAKGWLADRALARLAGYPTAVVDCDGDIAIRVTGRQPRRFGIADPRVPGRHLAELDLRSPSEDAGRTFGLATSGTSVHRWLVDGVASHHLIDPRTGRPARTDVLQATVLAGSAGRAEAIAKTAVILGSDAALERLGRADVDGAVLLTEHGETLVTPATEAWLA